MDQDIKKALLKLDIGNDDHWTADGCPRVEALKIEGLKRGQLMKAAPYFTRLHPSFEAPVQDDPENIEERNESAGTHLTTEPERETTINFESTEFGGTAPLAPVGTKPKTASELRLELDSLNRQCDANQLEINKLIEHGQALKRRIQQVEMEMGAPVNSQENQQRIMNFLAFTQSAPPPTAPIDKAFQPQRDPTKQRPVRTPRDVNPQ